MNEPTLIAIVVASIAVFAAVGFMIVSLRRDHQKAAREDVVAKAAQEYLSQFNVRAQIVGTTLGNGKIALMIETKPHKKLRFSHIIEQPIKQFIEKQAGIEVDRIFWRFPVPEKQEKVPDVQYGIPTTVMLPPEQPAILAKAANVAKDNAVEEDEDDYFLKRDIHIEEVNWNEFSTITRVGQKNTAA